MDGGLRTYVLQRDGGCVARFVNSKEWAKRWPMLQGLPEPGLCGNQWGDTAPSMVFTNLTVDHVKTDLAMAKRAPDDPDHLWAVCSRHHVATSWVTHAAVRAAAREYIPVANEYARAHGWPVYPVPTE